MIGYDVRYIHRDLCAPFILGIHYAKRWPSVSYSFGLFELGKLVGVVTYGTPPSSPLRIGICGEAYALDVIELNRLCLKNNKPNEASYLVATSLKMIPQKKIIVSFADLQHGHVGYVYQACNFMYCGLSAKRTNWTVRGMEHLHGHTIADEFRGVPNRSQAMRQKYGSDFFLSERSRKHKYVYFAGPSLWKRAMRKHLKYPVMPYPKLNTLEDIAL